MARSGSKRTSREAKRPAFAIAGWMLAVLAIPRIARILYPEVWIEDDFYLESAYLVSAGMRPYIDFVHPHMPLLEWIAAGYIRIFGASHLSLECLNEAAIYLTGILTLALARQVAGQRAAICAAILYAFSALVFRYHVYEREIFVGAIVTGAALLALREDSSPAMQAGWQAALWIAACAIKLTAVIPAAVVLGYLAVGRRRMREAAIAGAAIALGLSFLSAILYRLYGFEFVFQTFIFHFMKGRDLGTNLALYPCAILDVMMPLFALGLIRLGLERQFRGAGVSARPSRRVLRLSESASRKSSFSQHPARDGVWLVLVIVLANYIFFGMLSPTAWAHNYLDSLPLLAIVAGLGLERWINAARAALAGAQGAGRELRWAAGGAGLIVVSLVVLAPLANENWLRGSVYGFGFVPRDELSAVAAALRSASAPGEAVVAPTFLCFEANRPELIRYPETYGIYREAKKLYRSEGFFAARRELGRQDFFDLIARTAHYWADTIDDAVARGKVDAVVLDSRIELLPLVDPPIVKLTPDYLAAHGFTPSLRTEHFVVWVRPRAHGSPGNIRFGMEGRSEHRPFALSSF